MKGFAKLSYVRVELGGHVEPVGVPASSSSGSLEHELADNAIASAATSEATTRTETPLRRILG